MVNLVVGDDYANRKGEKVTIVEELSESHLWYKDGLRFKGVTNPDTSLPFYTTETMLFQEDGKSFAKSSGTSSTPSDLVGYFIETPEIVFEVDVKVGDIAGMIRNNQVKSGLFKGWEITNRFEITEKRMADIIYSGPRDKHPATNEALIIALNSGGRHLEGSVRSVLVVYENNGKNYIAALYLPDSTLKG